MLKQFQNWQFTLNFRKIIFPRAKIMILTWQVNARSLNRVYELRAHYPICRSILGCLFTYKHLLLDNEGQKRRDKRFQQYLLINAFFIVKQGRINQMSGHTCKIRPVWITEMWIILMRIRIPDQPRETPPQKKIK